jgi:ureidoglycolate hydrolase
MKDLMVRIEPAVPGEIKEYGIITAMDEQRAPDNSGEGWKCWYPIGELKAGNARSIGIVRTEKQSRQIEAMEQHLDREEWVFALDHPIIQVIALSTDADMKVPDPASVKAVRLEPGQGVVIFPGVWHAAGLPAAAGITLYGFALGKATRPDVDPGWVKFADNSAVILTE